MYRHGFVEICLGGAHLDGNAEPLEHLVAPHTLHMQTNNLEGEKYPSFVRLVTRFFTWDYGLSCIASVAVIVSRPHHPRLRPRPLTDETETHKIRSRDKTRSRDLHHWYSRHSSRGSGDVLFWIGLTRELHCGSFSRKQRSKTLMALRLTQSKHQTLLY